MTASLRPIDREDRNGLFTSHWTLDGVRALCGIVLGRTQQYSANGMCRRCARKLGVIAPDRAARPDPFADHSRDLVRDPTG